MKTLAKDVDVDVRRSVAPYVRDRRLIRHLKNDDDELVSSLAAAVKADEKIGWLQRSGFAQNSIRAVGMAVGLLAFAVAGLVVLAVHVLLRVAAIAVIIGIIALAYYGYQALESSQPDELPVTSVDPP